MHRVRIEHDFLSDFQEILTYLGNLLLLCLICDSLASLVSSIILTRIKLELERL